MLVLRAGCALVLALVVSVRGVVLTSTENRVKDETGGTIDEVGPTVVDVRRLRETAAAIEGANDTFLRTRSSTANPATGVLLQRKVDPNFLYVADPNALVVNDTIYLFCSTDPPFAGPSTKYNAMREYTLLTTTSLETKTDWTNHGVVLRPAGQFPKIGAYQNRLMFAPTAAYNDGWFYFYFPFLVTASGAASVGIAKSQTPTDFNSWEIAVPIIPKLNLFDPAVMIAADGRPYLYGNSRTYWQSATAHFMLGAPLNPDYVTLQNMPVAIYAGFVTEAVWAFWRENVNPDGSKQIIYYFFARSQVIGSHDCIMYWMADTPIPSIPKNVAGTRLTPDQYDAPPHASAIQFKGKWYFFYHSGVENNGNRWKRSTCIDEMQFYSDGRIVPITFSCQYIASMTG